MRGYRNADGRQPRCATVCECPAPRRAAAGGSRRVRRARPDQDQRPPTRVAYADVPTWARPTDSAGGGCWWWRFTAWPSTATPHLACVDSADRRRLGWTWCAGARWCVSGSMSVPRRSTGVWMRVHERGVAPCGTDVAALCGGGLGRSAHRAVPGRGYRHRFPCVGRQLVWPGDSLTIERDGATQAQQMLLPPSGTGYDIDPPQIFTHEGTEDRSALRRVNDRAFRRRLRVEPPAAPGAGGAEKSAAATAERSSADKALAGLEDPSSVCDTIISASNSAK